MPTFILSPSRSYGPIDAVVLILEPALLQKQEEYSEVVMKVSLTCFLNNVLLIESEYLPHQCVMARHSSFHVELYKHV